VKKLDHKNLNRRKKKIAKRLERRNWEAQPSPMFTGSNIQYEVDGRQQGIAQGGIGGGIVAQPSPVVPNKKSGGQHNIEQLNKVPGQRQWRPMPKISGFLETHA
jgi:hypothetical protein